MNMDFLDENKVKKEIAQETQVPSEEAILIRQEADKNALQSIDLLRNQKRYDKMYI